MSFTKLSSTIVHSTVWREPHHVRIVWITMLALSDPNGYVGASVPGLADAARVTLAECEQALASFLGPDPYSRTSDHEGRRIEKVEGGWRLLNHALYRAGRDPEARRLQNREAQARRRERERTTSAADVADGADADDNCLLQPESAHAEAEAEADTEAERSTDRGNGGRGTKVKGSKPRLKTWRRFPQDYVPDLDDRALAAELGVNVESELAKCRNHEFKRGRSDAKATFQTWLRNAAEFGGGKSNAARGGRNGAPVVQRGGEIRNGDSSWLDGGGE